MAATSGESQMQILSEVPEGFVYEQAYLEYLLFDEAEVEANGNCHTTLAFNSPQDLHNPYYRMFDKVPITYDSFTQALRQVLRLRPRRKLIHFASENDRHWFFASGGTRKIFMVDLGESPLVAKPTGHRSFESFIEDIRRQYGVPRWQRPNPSIEGRSQAGFAHLWTSLTSNVRPRMKRLWKWFVPVSQHETRRIGETPGGFLYRDEKGVDHIVLWADIQSVSWYEPPYGPLGSVPSWSITTSGGTLEVEEWWEGADELLKLFVENLRGFTLPPRAHEYDKQPPEGHPCWPLSWK